MDFNLEQYLKDRGWVELSKKDRYGQQFTSYTKKLNRKNIEHVYEFEILGEGNIRTDSLYCKIMEKGLYSIYYVMFEGSLKSYTEFDVISNCLGIGEVGG